jgi:anti-sigma factor RsiW
MDGMTPHPELKELLGAYALDAVDPDESEMVERHLAGCPECQVELAEYREVIGLMGDVRTEPPPGVWDRIVAGLQDRPPPARLDRGGTPAPPPGSGQAGPRHVSVRVFTVVAAIAAVVIAALGVEVARLNSRANRSPTAVAGQALVNAFDSASGQASARHVALHATSGAQPVPAVVLSDGTAFVDGRPLPRLPADRTYQLWGIGADGAPPVSLAIMGQSPGIQQFGVPTGVGTLAITTERAGGAVAPSAAPIYAGQLVS